MIPNTSKNKILLVVVVFLVIMAVLFLFKKDSSEVVPPASTQEEEVVPSDTLQSSSNANLPNAINYLFNTDKLSLNVNTDLTIASNEVLLAKGNPSFYFSKEGDNREISLMLDTKPLVTFKTNTKDKVLIDINGIDMIKSHFTTSKNESLLFTSFVEANKETLDTYFGRITELSDTGEGVKSTTVNVLMEEEVESQFSVYLYAKKMIEAFFAAYGDEQYKNNLLHITEENVSVGIHGIINMKPSKDVFFTTSFGTEISEQMIHKHLFESFFLFSPSEFLADPEGRIIETLRAYDVDSEKFRLVIGVKNNAEKGNLEELKFQLTALLADGFNLDLKVSIQVSPTHAMLFVDTNPVISTPNSRDILSLFQAFNKAFLHSEKIKLGVSADNPTSDTLPSDSDAPICINGVCVGDPDKCIHSACESPISDESEEGSSCTGIYCAAPESSEPVVNENPVVENKTVTLPLVVFDEMRGKPSTLSHENTLNDGTVSYTYFVVPYTAEDGLSTKEGTFTFKYDENGQPVLLDLTLTTTQNGVVVNEYVTQFDGSFYMIQENGTIRYGQYDEAGVFHDLTK